MQKKLAVVFIFILSAVASFSQTFNKKMEHIRIDTAIVKENVLNLLKFSFSRSLPDSVIKYCGFPFYDSSRHAKIYRSSGEFKAMLEKAYKMEENKPVAYTVEFISGIDTCIHFRLKIRDLVCITVKVHMPDIGEGNEGIDSVIKFYVAGKYPYLVFGSEDK